MIQDISAIFLILKSHNGHFFHRKLYLSCLRMKLFVTTNKIIFIILCIENLIY